MNEAYQLYTQLGLLGAIGVVFIWELISNHKSMTKYTEQLMEQKDAFIEQLDKQRVDLVAQSASQIDLLNKIYEALKPNSFAQSRDLISMTIECSRLRSIEVLKDVIRQNNIHVDGHESVIQENINRELGSINQHNLNLLQRFSYSGKTLDKYMPDWWQETAKVMHDELYVQIGNDEDRLRRNIGSVFTRLQNEAEQRLNGG